MYTVTGGAPRGWLTGGTEWPFRCLGAKQIVTLWWSSPSPLIVVPCGSFDFFVHALWNMCLCTKESTEPKKRYFSMQPLWYHFYVRNWPLKCSGDFSNLTASQPEMGINACFNFCARACMLFGLCLCVCVCVLVCTWRQWESGVLFISNARAAIAQQINIFIEPHDILIPDDSHSMHCIGMESFYILDPNFLATLVALHLTPVSD